MNFLQLILYIAELTSFKTSFSIRRLWIWALDNVSGTESVVASVVSVHKARVGRYEEQFVNYTVSAPPSCFRNDPFER